MDINSYLFSKVTGGFIQELLLIAPLIAAIPHVQLEDVFTFAGMTCVCIFFGARGRGRFLKKNFFLLFYFLFFKLSLF